MTSARCLDITRLIRRAGRRMTGVDRVESAYLRELSGGDTPFFALARTRLGYILLDRDGARAICEKLERDRWGGLDGLGRLMRGDEVRRRAEADLRRHSLSRAVPPRLKTMLHRHLPPGVTYLNTGHSNLTKRVIGAVKGVEAARIAVLVHDTIPLDYPEFQRPETRARFGGFLRRVAGAADLVICNSQTTLDDARRHFAYLGRVPPGTVAPLGVDLASPGPCPPLPDGAYFVTVGTIEPRKNHALLLDVWDGYAAAGRDAPHLMICGARGWRNDAVLARLDAGSPLVHEHADLDDGAIAGLLQLSNGLLFPSHAEGYGLPPLEAAALGVPVVCADLPVYREVLKDKAIYLDASDRYCWQKTIDNLAEQKPPPSHFAPPTWQAHFNVVLSLV